MLMPWMAPAQLQTVRLMRPTGYQRMKPSNAPGPWLLKHLVHLPFEGTRGLASFTVPSLIHHIVKPSEPLALETRLIQATTNFLMLVHFFGNHIHPTIMFRRNFVDYLLTKPTFSLPTKIPLTSNGRMASYTSHWDTPHHL